MLAASFAAVASTTAVSNRIFASANNCAGVSSGPTLIAAEHMPSPSNTILYPAYAAACPISLTRLTPAGTSASVQPRSFAATVSPDARAVDSVV